MATPPKSPPSSDPSSAQSASPGAISRRNFGVGLGLAAIPMLAGLWLAVDMTYGGHWAAVGLGTWGGAIAIPLVCGLLAAKWGQPITQSLGRALDNLQLPF
jgi:hypothetical protein